MYVRLHVRKCKRQLNELFHALSKSFSLSPSLSVTCLKFNNSVSLNFCTRAAALATGCQVSIEYAWGSVFDLRQNKALGMHAS